MPDREDTAPGAGGKALACHSEPGGIERREREMQELRRELEELRRDQRLKNEYLSLATHELSAPLTAIRAYVEALSENYGAPGFTRGPEFLGVLGRETARLARIVERAREMWNAVDGLAPRCRPVRLAEVVGDVASGLRPLLAERSMALEVRLPADLPECQADPDLLQQVLVNLVHNAVKFSPPGGTVHLRATAAADSLDVEVRDEGFGIAPEELERIFEPGFRSRDARAERQRGLGLGLRIVQTIVERHGGRVTVESRVDRGTTFRLSLPRAAAVSPRR